MLYERNWLVQRLKAPLDDPVPEKYGWKVAQKDKDQEMSAEQKVEGARKEEEDESRLTVGFVGRPQAFIEKPRKLDGTFNYYSKEPTTVQFFGKKQTPWGAKNTCLPPKKRCKLFSWCRRRKRYKTKKVHTTEIPRVSRRREILHEVEIRQRPASLPPVIIEEPPKSTHYTTYTPEKKRHASLSPVIIQEPLHQTTAYHTREKKRAFKVKPTTVRYPIIKTYRRKAPLGERFVNCMYRVCCQFYCYLTCIIIVVCVVIFAF